MSFSGIWRQECGCCDNNDDIQIPNVIELNLYGFLYRTIPDIFTSDNLKIMPIKFEVNYYDLLYTFKIYKPKNGVVKLCLSDDIIPTVISNNNKLNIKRLYNKDGYYYFIVYLN